MTFKQKSRYVWDYYKVQLIIVLAVIIALSVFIYSKATKKDTFCSIAYISTDVKKIDTDFLSESLNDAVLKDNKKATYIASKFILDELNPSNYSANPKLTGQLESKNFDVAIVTKKFITDNMNNNLFMDLSTLSGFDSLQLSNCSVINGDTSSEKKSIYGISIKDIKLLGKMNLSEKEDNYLAVMNTSTHKDAAIKTIKELLSK